MRFIAVLSLVMAILGCSERQVKEVGYGILQNKRCMDEEGVPLCQENPAPSYDEYERERQKVLKDKKSNPDLP